jgi:uncharacterized protein YrrD
MPDRESRPHIVRFRRCNTLKGFRLGATDGEIGKVEDFFFDDRAWTVRYLVADTGFWLPNRLVLISPHALGEIQETENVLRVQLTRHQIEESPPITADQPVSRQFEREYYRYYGWPVYWTGPALWGPGPYPLYYAPLETVAGLPPESEVDSGDPHLRSVKEITGYHIEARDGEMGHVEDVIMEENSWVIRYLVVNTGKWLPGKKVLVAPPWIQEMSWARSAVSTDLPRSSIQAAPEYDPDVPIARDYEISLFQHYSRVGYWSDDDSPERNRAASRGSG